jgi:hypothetical protein
MFVLVHVGSDSFYGPCVQVNTTLIDFKIQCREHPWMSHFRVSLAGEAAMLAALQVRSQRAYGGVAALMCGCVAMLVSHCAKWGPGWMSRARWVWTECVSSAAGAGQCGVDHVSRSGPG